MFGFMEELFAPGRKHTEDERNRLELTREEAGDSDPGRGPIDLDSGKVVIRPAAPPATTSATTSADVSAGAARPPGGEQP